MLLIVSNGRYFLLFTSEINCLRPLFFALLLLSWRLACRLPEFVEFLLPFMLTLIICRLILLV
ncbi:hypothetical protein DXA95_13600 [Odoribacter sp. OF09-27XD]|nr:hypothetical protein DXA95_13600 [Odoribacter sp. OF09-27XD]